MNTPNADRYHELVRSKFGDKSFDAMLDFARSSTKYVPNVVMTTVDTTITKRKRKNAGESVIRSVQNTESAHGRINKSDKKSSV